MDVVIWHNPRCTKSRLTLELLRSRGFDPKIVEYLNTTPAVAEISSVLKLLNIAAHEFIRKGEPVYQELDLANEKDEAKLISAMYDHPILIERPVVIIDGKAAIGRPPENVLPIL